MFEVVFLGTGAAVPTPTRNLSSTAVVWHGEIFLFDCGEGTQMQFRKARLRPGKISRIFVSHFHGDHIFGLPGLLTSMHMAGCRQPVHLYGPEGVREYIEFHRRIARFTLRYPLHIFEVPETSTGTVWQEAAYRIVCKPLQHRIPCFGWAIVEEKRPGKFDVAKATELGIPNGPVRSQLQQGKSLRLENGKTVTPEMVVGPPRRGHKFAYCLDTAPSPMAVELAREADLLIHDATFEHAEAESAVETGHSTARQAAEIARQAGVQLLALSHLSGRYSAKDEPALLREARDVHKRTIIARDLRKIAIDYVD